MCRDPHNYLIVGYFKISRGRMMRTPRQPHLSAIVQARHFSLFGHTAQMPDETDAKKILTASRLENWRRATLVLCGWRLSSKTWNPITSPWMKQLTLLRIVHSRNWCLRLMLSTPSGACQKWRSDNHVGNHCLPWSSVKYLFCWWT